MTPKDLKKLIKLCRELGVKSYKGEGFEFELTEQAPIVTKGKDGITVTPQPAQSDEIESDTLTEDQLLMWSVPDAAKAFGIGEQDTQ